MGQSANKRRRRKRVPIGRYLLLLVLLAAVIGGGYMLFRPPAAEGGRDGSSDTPAFRNDADSYQLLSMTEADLHKGVLVAVNKDHAYTFPEDQQLISIFDNKGTHYNVRDRNVLVDSRIMAPLNQWLEDFFEQSGLTTVNVVAGQRSYAYQQTLYQNSVAQNGEAHTQKYVALPGHSEHHTGLAVDLSIYYENGTSAEYDGTGPYKWINDNSYRYGFVLRYEQSKEDTTGIAYEPWHFRYVGIPHASLMTEKGLCLEEYVTYLRQFPYNGEHLKTTYNGQTYEIYYETGAQIHVPKEGTYTVSGNNEDGFIITAEI